MLETRTVSVMARDTSMFDGLYRRQEVERGIQLLDKRNPGWREKFNPDTLNLASMFHCTLGQVYGWWGDGMKELGLIGLEAIRHGFLLEPVLTRGEQARERQHREYQQLTETWKQLVPTTQPQVLETELVLV